MATSIQLRAINRNNIYHRILIQEQTSKQKLAADLHLSFPTVSQILKELTSDGLIEQKGAFESTGGRKAQIILSKPDAKVAIGLDITRNHVNLIMTDLGKNILKSVRKRVAFKATAAYFEMLGQMIETNASEYHDRVLGVMISIPGIISEDGKHIVYAPLLNQPADLYERLKPYIKYPYRFVNDASAGAFSELYGTAMRDDFVYLMLSNSVGGAIVINNQIVEGIGIRSGEFGHMTLVPGGKKCYCGQKGCVDAYCSALRLSDDLESFFPKLREGNASCKKKWDTYMDYMATVVNNLQISTNLEVVIGGYVGWFLAPYLDEVKKRVAALCCFRDDTIRISVGSHTKEASAFGAALYYIREFVEQV